MGDHGKYNIGGIIIGTPNRGDYMYNSGPPSKGRGIVQRYWFGGGDL